MRRLIITCVAFCAVVGWGIQPALHGAAAGRESKSGGADRVLARIHFKGFDQLGSATNAAALQQIWKFSQTDALGKAALDKLAPALLKALSGKGDAASAALLRPMLDDLGRSESILELAERPGHAPAWALAIKLNEQRRTLWRESWGKLFPNGSGGKGACAFAAGAQGWIVVAQDSAAAPGGKISTPLWREAGSLPANSGAGPWLKADADWPRLTNSLPRLAGLALPKVALTIETKGDGLRTEVKLAYATPQTWKLDPWRIPTNSIRDPLVSFTAVRGIAPWVARQKWFQETGLEAPNQATAWGQTDTPFQIQVAFPVASATNAMKHLAANWLPKFNEKLASSPLEAMQYNASGPQISTRFMFLAPFIRRAPEANGEFLNAGFFPLTVLSRKMPPPALYEQLDRKNLLYYDWEVTQYRLEQLRETTETLATLMTLPPLEAKSAGRAWIDTIAPKLGNTITEVTQTSPTELTLIRRSHIGLNGIELVALAGWIDGANFPGIDTSIGFRPTPSRRGGKGAPVPIPLP